MKTRIIFIVFAFCYTISFVCNAQWVRTNGPTNVTVYSLAVNDLYVFAGGGDGNVYRTSDDGKNWSSTSLVGFGEVSSLAVNASDVFAGIRGCWVYCAGSVFYSSNNGEEWKPTTYYNWLHAPVISITVSNSNILAGRGGDAVSIGGCVYLSYDYGLNWMAPICPGEITSLVSSGSNVFAGTHSVYRSTDNGETWEQTSLNNMGIASLAVSGSDVFAGTYFSGVFISTDNGESWEQTTLNNHWIKSLAIKGRNIFAGTYENGVHLSTDNGLTWTQINDGLGNQTVHALTITDEYIFAGTDTAWIWRRPLLEIIPVELISFTANVSGNSVHLNWSTASEINNQGFEIERASSSPRQEDWEIIGFVNGYGTTSETQFYSFVDEDLNPGSYAYRLKQIDFDGTFEYSNIIDVEIGTPEKFALFQNYPNPFNPTTVISWQSPISSWQTLKVYDMLGREVATLIDEYKPAGSYEVISISYPQDPSDKLVSMFKLKSSYC